MLGDQPKTFSFEELRNIVDLFQYWIKYIKNEGRQVEKLYTFQFLH